MTPKQYFLEQAKFNKWLFDLTPEETQHILSMLEEHAKAAYNQAIRDADEHIISRLKPIINAQFIYDSIKITKLLK